MTLKVMGYFLFIFCFNLQAENFSINIDDCREYAILEHFFKNAFQNEEYFYVLEGEKPISYRCFHGLDQFPIAWDIAENESQFINTLLVREVIPIWKKACSMQKKYILKAVPLSSKELPLGWEISFIHLPKLQKVIEENIDLFRYILSPILDARELAEKIAFSEEKTTDILLNNHVLIGIVLGFGTHNSIVVGRKENIQSLFISQDEAPFGVKTLSLHDFKYLYGFYCIGIRGGDKTAIKEHNSRFPFHPSVGFGNFQDEFNAIDATNDPLPSCLKTQFPAFIYEAHKGGPSNKPMFDKLIQIQKRGQAFLKNPNFLEELLTRIGGKKPKISCKKPYAKQLRLSFFENSLDTKTWNYILGHILDGLEDDKQRAAFLNALNNLQKMEIPQFLGASRSLIEGIKKTIADLFASDSHFDILSKTADVQSIIPNYLYYKTTIEGKGKELKNSSRVRIAYTISDPNEKILFAHFDTWIDLSQTISGFAHGVIGMKVGEERQIFIHPCLAYGALATLPCLEFMAKVNLLDFDESYSKSMPSVEPLDVSWIQDTSFIDMLEESIVKIPIFKGCFYRDIRNKIEGVEKKAEILPANLEYDNYLPVAA